MASKDAFHLYADMPEDRRIEKELRFAIDYLNANRLSESAKWASELLSSLKNRKSANSSMTTSFMQDSLLEGGVHRERDDEVYDMDEDEQEEIIDPSTFTHDIHQYPIDNNESFDFTFYERKSKAADAVGCARILFDLREYRKA